MGEIRSEESIYVRRFFIFISDIILEGLGGAGGKRKEDS